MGELLALRWRDVDFTAATVRVRASYANGYLTTPKSGKVRAVPLAPDVASALALLGRRGHWRSDDDLVFAGEAGGFLDGSALRRRYKAALVAAVLRPLRFHDLRHTFSTRMITTDDARRVQEWMSHADIQTTMRCATCITRHPVATQSSSPRHFGYHRCRTRSLRGVAVRSREQDVSGRLGTTWDVLRLSAPNTKRPHPPDDQKTTCIEPPAGSREGVGVAVRRALHRTGRLGTSWDVSTLCVLCVCVCVAGVEGGRAGLHEVRARSRLASRSGMACAPRAWACAGDLAAAGMCEADAVAARVVRDVVRERQHRAGLRDHRCPVRARQPCLSHRVGARSIARGAFRARRPDPCPRATGRLMLRDPFFSVRVKAR